MADLSDTMEAALKALVASPLVRLDGGYWVQERRLDAAHANRDSTTRAPRDVDWWGTQTVRALVRRGLADVTRTAGHLQERRVEATPAAHKYATKRWRDA